MRGPGSSLGLFVLWDPVLAMGRAKSNWAKGGSRHARGYGSAWDKVRAEVMERDKGICQMHLRDGITRAASQVDHIRPKAKGGTDDPSNLWALCRACHDRKSAADRGATYRPKPRIGLDGYPIDD